MLKQKTNAELLASFKKMNKIAREKFALKRGFTSPELFKLFLEKDALGKTNPKKSSKVVVDKTTLPVIHIVDILDKSGSMNDAGRFEPSKLEIALSAINEGIEDLRTHTNCIYTYSLCLFSSPGNIQIAKNKEPLNKVPVIKTTANGMTALYDAIGDTLEEVSKNLQPTDKVLVNIYTDGEENSSRKYSKESISTLIEKYQEKGFTITFIGTHSDTQAVVKDLKIHQSNTMSYDGSSKDLKRAMTATKLGRTEYAAKVATGQSVVLGFYKNIIKK